MTDYRAPDEPYTTSFEATVASVDDRVVTLDRTYFYAEGGGQPADRGTLAGVPVVDVQKEAGEVAHTLAEPPAVEPGETVAGQVDEAYRTYLMCAHTASHLLYGAGRRVLCDLGYGGFGIDDEKVRVDFETTTDVDDGSLVELERLVNRAVWESVPVTWESVPKDDALDREEIAFNVATEEGVFSESETVRVVEIEGWDVAACGGTHVRSTREIGPVTLLDRSNPGEGMTRVEFAVGPVAIERRAAERRAATEAAATLETGVTDLPEVASRLREENAALQADLDDLRAEVLDARLAGVDRVERAGQSWLVGPVDGFGPNEVSERAQAAVGDVADVVALCGRDGRAFVVVATGGDPDANEVVADVTDEFGGGGGGSPTFAQGGGMDADPDAVVDYLRSA